MIPYLGDYQYGAVIYVPFNTFNAAGASVTITGLAVTDIEIYKNGSVAQRASDAGYTLLDTDGIDFDAITGIHGFSIDTADNTTAGFWGPGNDYFLVLSAITVDAQTVSFVALFSMENRAGAGVLLRTTIATLASQTSFTLTAGSVDNSAYKGALIIVSDAASVVQKAMGAISAYTGSTKTVTLLADPAIFTMAVGDYVTIIANVSLKATAPTNTLDVTATGAAGVDWGNVENPTTTVGLSNTTVGIVTLLNGLAAGVITAASIATDAITAAKIAADAISATKIAAGAITAAKFAASAIDATAIATGAFTAAKFAAGAFDAVWTVATRLLTAGTNIVLAKGTGVTGFNDLSTAQVNTEVDTALADARLDELLAADSDIDGAAPPVVGSVFHELLTKTTGSFTYDQTTDSLEAVRDNQGTAGAGLTGIPWNASWDTEIQSEVNDALVAHNLDHVAGTATGIPAIPAGTYLEQIIGAGVVTLDELKDELIGPLVTVVSDGSNTATTFKVNSTVAATNYWADAWLSFETGTLAGQVKKVTAFNFTTDFITVHAAYTATPTAGDTARLVTR